MTEQASTLERTFEGHEMSIVMALDSEGKEQPALIVAEIARILGYDRQALHQIIKRKETIFCYQCVNVSLTRGVQKRSVNVLFAPGVIGLLCNLEPQNVEDPERQTLIVRFQKWAYETLAAILKGEYVANGKYSPIIESYLKGELISREEAWREQQDIRSEMRMLQLQLGAKEDWDAMKKVGEWVAFELTAWYPLKTAEYMTGKTRKTLVNWIKSEKVVGMRAKTRWAILGQSLLGHLRKDLKLQFFLPLAGMVFGEPQPPVEEVEA